MPEVGLCLKKERRRRAAPLVSCDWRISNYNNIYEYYCDESTPRCERRRMTNTIRLRRDAMAWDGMGREGRGGGGRKSNNNYARCKRNGSPHSAVGNTRRSATASEGANAKCERRGRGNEPISRMSRMSKRAAEHKTHGTDGREATRRFYDL